MHGEETPHSQKNRNRNSQVKQEKNNIKQQSWTLRDGQLTQRIVLHHFCLPDAPFDLDIRNNTGRLNTLALSSQRDQHQRLPPELPGWNSLSLSTWSLSTTLAFSTCHRKEKSISSIAFVNLYLGCYSLGTAKDIFSGIMKGDTIPSLLRPPQSEDSGLFHSSPENNPQNYHT